MGAQAAYASGPNGCDPGQGNSFKGKGGQWVNRSVIPEPAFNRKVKTDSGTEHVYNKILSLSLLQPGLSGMLCWFGGPRLNHELKRYRNGCKEQTKQPKVSETRCRRRGR